MTDTDLAQKIAEKANMCVKCGLCLPACPTFSLTHSENESPRGRISLMQGLASGQLKATDTLTEYLDHCLQCRACEAVCPSNVDYGHLIKDSRKLLNQKTNKLKKTNPIFNWITPSSTHWRITSSLLHLYQRCGLQYLLQKLGLLKLLKLQALDKMLSKKVYPLKTWQSYYPPLGKHIKDVSVFFGCINSITEQQTIFDAISLLQKLGYGIKLPKTQYCCGALAELQQKNTDKQLQKHINSLESLEIDTVIILATGCLAHLIENTNTHYKYQDVNAFLLEHFEAYDKPNIRPLEKSILIHTPCTQRNVLKQAGASEKLLAFIPGLTLESIPTTTHCCGNAGDYGLKFPGDSQQLASKLILKIEQHNPDIVVTTNIGCSLQIQSELKKHIKVLHPVSILNQQIDLG